MALIMTGFDGTVVTSFGHDEATNRAYFTINGGGIRYFENVSSDAFATVAAREGIGTYLEGCLTRGFVPAQADSLP